MFVKIRQLKCSQEPAQKRDAGPQRCAPEKNDHEERKENIGRPLGADRPCRQIPRQRIGPRLHERNLLREVRNDPEVCVEQAANGNHDEKGG